MAINYWAVLVAALSMFLLGGLWYSPVLFGGVWMRANQLTEKDLEDGNPAKIYGVSFLFSLIMSANLAAFLSGPETDMAWGATAGFLAGFGWVALGIGMVSLFERRPFSYMLVNGAYMTVAFTLMGLILGAWR
ncbi:MAG TPA: DUF1761 domain-containing protein [Acidobacteriota bacterium]|nr:DUF1761 domain-containing protein [Acidobacteriota bacterium]